MKPFNCVETRAILVCKLLTSDSFKNEITYKLCMQKDCDFYIAILEHIQLCAKKKEKKKRAQTFKNDITNVFTNPIFNKSVNMIWHL